jgi:hypothetical protein
MMIRLCTDFDLLYYHCFEFKHVVDPGNVVEFASVLLTH